MTILRMNIKEVTEVIGRKIIVESGKMLRDLTENIENGPDIVLETGGKPIDPEKVHVREDKEIDLENKGFPQKMILNKFLFMFIMEIFNRDV